MCDEDEVSTMDVRVRMGDAIDPFQLANGFEAVIGYRGGRSRKSCVTTPPQCHSCLLYENLCPAMDSCGVMGMFWGLSAGARTARRHS